MENSPETKIQKIAVKLFAFLQRCRLNCKVIPHNTQILTYTFTINDVTDQGDPFGISFDLSTTDIAEVEDTEEAVEKFCFGMALNVSNTLFRERATRLLEHQEETGAGKIYVPGA